VKSGYRHVGFARFPVDGNAVSQELVKLRPNRGFLINLCPFAQLHTEHSRTSYDCKLWKAASLL
jgi:hypothetical protein